MYKSIFTNLNIIYYNIKNGVPFKIIIIYLLTKSKNIIYKFNNRNYLRFLFKKIYNKKKISETWSSYNISYWHYLFSKSFNFRINYKILEIGSYEGASSIFLLHLFKNSTIYCVDTWSAKFKSGVTKNNVNYSTIESRFDNNLKEYDRRLRKFKTESSLFFKKINKNLLFDLIYIDGSHKYADVLNDAMNGFDHLKKGGIIIFDDFNKAAVQKAILFFVNNKSEKINILMVYHQFIIKRIL